MFHFDFQILRLELFRIIKGCFSNSMETLSVRKEDLPSSSQTRTSPTQSGNYDLNDSPGFNTVFRLFLHQESGKLRLEESISNSKLLKRTPERFTGEVIEDSTLFSKRAKVQSFTSANDMALEIQNLEWRNLLTQPLSFLQIMKRKKNKADFLKNFSFTFEELLDFEGRYRHFLYDHKIYESHKHQTDLSVFNTRKFHSAFIPHFAQSFSNKCPVFKAKAAKAKKLLVEKYNIQATDSQILRLMTLCDTEDIFWYLLSSQRDLIAEFLGFFKPCLPGINKNVSQ